MLDTYHLKSDNATFHSEQHNEACLCFQGGQCIYSSKEGSDDSLDLNSLLHHLRPYFMYGNNRINSHMTGKAVLNDFIQVRPSHNTPTSTGRFCARQQKRDLYGGVVEKSGSCCSCRVESMLTSLCTGCVRRALCLPAGPCECTAERWRRRCRAGDGQKRRGAELL